MPRWLIVFIVTLLLPCYGFAALGQPAAVVTADSPYTLQFEASDSADVLEDNTSSPEANPGAAHVDPLLDTPELIGHLLLAEALALHTSAPRRMGLANTATPFLAGPRRPPRSAGSHC